MKTAVVIPFFQREKGILPRAVLSALRQDGVDRPLIIVVDDGSPVPAEPELTGPIRDHPGEIVVIRQRNAGPGAARNTGLDAVPDGCELVAFLDSDDEWEPSHLRNALVAFREGCDFYFADNLDTSGKTTRFGRFRRQGTFRPSDHPSFESGSPLRWFKGDFTDQLVREFVVATPTVVVRRSFLGRLRFPVDLRRAGEDHLLWLEIAASGPRVAFSERVECRLGEGVNIFDGSSWGTEGALERSVDFSRLLRKMRDDHAGTEEQRFLLSRRIAQSRRELIRILLHDIARMRSGTLRLARRQIREDPSTLGHIFPEFLRIVLERITGARREPRGKETSP